MVLCTVINTRMLLLILRFLNDAVKGNARGGINNNNKQNHKF